MSLQVIRVLQFEDNRIEARLTQHWLAESNDGTFELVCVDRLSAGLERLTQGGIDIVLLDLNLTDSRGEATFDNLYARFPEIPVVVLTGEFDEAIGISTVTKGAQDYLVKKRVDGASLIRVLRYALVRNRAQQEKIKSMQVSKYGQVIGFLGAKGGVGTTSTALNVAVALAMQGVSVILAELRPSFGTLAFHVTQPPARSLRALLDIPPERIGQEELNAILSLGPTGIRVLFGPKEDEADYMEVDPIQVEAIVKGLSRLADVVVLDLPSEASAATQTATRLCHSAIVVTERESSSLRAGKSVVKRIKSWGIRGNLAGGVVRIGLVIVNRTIYPNYSMGFDEIQAQMDCDIVGIIPWGANENLRALTAGVPLVAFLPDNDTALSYVEIVHRLTASAGSD